MGGMSMSQFFDILDNSTIQAHFCAFLFFLQILAFIYFRGDIKRG